MGDFTFCCSKSIESTLLPYWNDGMKDLSSIKGRQLAEKALEANPALTKKQIKVRQEKVICENIFSVCANLCILG